MIRLDLDVTILAKVTVSTSVSGYSKAFSWGCNRYIAGSRHNRIVQERSSINLMCNTFDTIGCEDRKVRWAQHP